MSNNTPYVQHSIQDAITGIEEARERLRRQKSQSPVEAGVKMEPAYNSLAEQAVEKDLRLAFGALQRRVLDIETASKQRDAKLEELSDKLIKLAELVNQCVDQMFAFIGELETSQQQAAEETPSVEPQE